MKISIITVTYNRCLQLSLGLGTLLPQLDNLNHDWEIIIVDDGSRDNTKNFVNATQQLWGKTKIKYIYIDYPEPRISCIPRNIGIKQSTGDVIIFTEPEALHVGDTINKLLSKMEEYPNNTILASQVWTMGERITKDLDRKYYDNPQLILNHPYAKIVSGNMQNTNAPDSDWAITGELHCNAGVLFATRKKWLEEIGGFDESFEGHGFDDLDLFNRLELFGHGIIKCPDIPVIHQWHDKSFYTYNIYDMANKNGKVSEERLHKKEYRANIGKEWGKYEGIKDNL